MILIRNELRVNIIRRTARSERIILPHRSLYAAVPGKIKFSIRQENAVHSILAQRTGRSIRRKFLADFASSP